MGWDSKCEPRVILMHYQARSAGAIFRSALRVRLKDANAWSKNLQNYKYSFRNARIIFDNCTACKIEHPAGLLYET